MKFDWAEGVPYAVTICDEDGIILYMNKKSISTFTADGGAALVGSNLLDCHPEPSRTKVIKLLNEHSSNIYTIEKHGVKKMIVQTPWYDGDVFGGLVELSIVLPDDMPHFIRK